MFNFKLNFSGGFTKREKDIVTRASLLWSSVIKSDFEPYPDFKPYTYSDHCEVDVTLLTIDGRSNKLALGWTKVIRPGTARPLRGATKVDKADIKAGVKNGMLYSAVLHEFGHVLGIGSNWDLTKKQYLKNPLSNNPEYTGPASMKAYRKLRKHTKLTPVPLANGADPASRGMHWRESVFGNELLTPSMKDANNPLSVLTIANLADLGYDVDYSKAQKYEMPPPGAKILDHIPNEHVCDSVMRPFPVLPEEFIG